MSSEPVVRAEGLTKQYVVGDAARGYSTLRESVMTGARRLVRREPRAGTSLRTAVSDLSFEIFPGEVVGFIGHNGAGKSTLLKLLGRITAPTSGTAEVRGRVGSLLEVGTGFHPELTGRENIFLNGAILGMRRREIEARFDEIVDFGEVGDQLDTPVKRYSSGQFVRLAFSVAAHLEPELLLVDEVLAVGDVSFQRRSLARMGEIARSGRTVLFVSHNMATIQALCTRGIVLEHGRAVADGPVDEAVSAYLRTLEALEGVALGERDDRRGRGETRVVHLSARPPGGGPVTTGGPLRLEVGLSALVPDTVVTLLVHDQLGQLVCSFDSSVPSAVDLAEPAGEAPLFVCDVETVPLVEGRYRLDVTVRGRGKRQDEVVAALHLDVVQGLLAGRPVTRDLVPGRVAVPHRWTVPVR